MLVVCSGNVCRSPIVATLLHAACPDLVVRSAGTHAARGVGWHPYTVAVLGEAGHPADGRSRRLRAGDVRDATLILTAETMHRGVVLRHDANAADRSYTLLEAARLLRKAPVPPGYGVRRLPAHLADALAAFPMEHDDDLPDPVTGSIEDFRWCLQRVQQALQVIVPAL